jgi:hypothetical protein
MKSGSQLTLVGTGFEKYTKTTRRAQFLAAMDRVVPWRELCARIAPVYPKPGNGRPPIGVERMLRMYFLQHLCTHWSSRTHYRAMRAVLGRYRRVPVWPFSSDCSFRGARQHDLFRPSLSQNSGFIESSGHVAALFQKRTLRARHGPWRSCAAAAVWSALWAQQSRALS